jgi:hypothetical protein
VLRLILAFVDIMLHRRGPEDLPSSRFLLWLLLVTLLGVYAAITLWFGGESRNVGVGWLVILLNVWFVWALLRTFNRQGRFRQTMTAVIGADLMLTVLRAPLIPLVEVPAAQQPPAVTLPMLLTTLIFFWSIDITAFVFSRALERPYLLCVAIVVAYTLLMLSLQTTLLQPVS